MSKNKPGTEVAVKDTNQYAVSNEFASQFDQSIQSAGDTMDASDFRIPKLTLIQKMTKSAFNTEDAPVGNFINSLEKMDMGNKFDVFIMTDIKLWKWNYEVKQGKEIKKEYLTITEFADAPKARDLFGNPNALPPELVSRMEHKGVTIDQLLPPDVIYRFNVLLVDEVVEGYAFPYTLDFTRSSAGEGNKLKNIFFKMRKLAKLPSYAKVFTIYSEEETSKDGHEYHVIKASSGRKIETDEIQAVEMWIKEMSANATKYTVDESDSDMDDVVDAEATVVQDDNNQPKF